MKMNFKKIIYAMTGGNGSGKTTFALKISKEKGALFFSLDKTIKEFNQPIESFEDYISHLNRALDLMSSQATQALIIEQSVVFDFGGGISSRSWLKKIAQLTGAEIEIYHLEVPIEERRKRIQKRNTEKLNDTYFFHMSDDEFNKHNTADAPPPPAEEGIRVVIVDNR